MTSARKWIGPVALNSSLRCLRCNADPVFVKSPMLKRVSSCLFKGKWPMTRWMREHESRMRRCCRINHSCKVRTALERRRCRAAAAAAAAEAAATACLFVSSKRGRFQVIVLRLQTTGQSQIEKRTQAQDLREENSCVRSPRRALVRKTPEKSELPSKSSQQSTSRTPPRCHRCLIIVH